jgi:hypothetical protein
VFSSSSRQLGSTLENVQLKRINLENVTLRQIAAMVETNLAQQGAHCRVAVESSMPDEPVPHFLVGDANALFWLHGVADVFQCRFELCDNNLVLFCKSGER